MTAIKYVAFLRGINVGGHATVKMENLKKAFEDEGYANVKTLLNSGNVLFETPEKNSVTLTHNIEQTLKKTFGFEISVILRTIAEIQTLIDTNPFKNIMVTPQTRLYITFLPSNDSNTQNLPAGSLSSGYESPDKDFQILQISKTEVCSVLTLSEHKNTTDIMKILEKAFGKKITTRNWNTVNKLAAIK